jgi:hypothetical protein
MADGLPVPPEIETKLAAFATIVGELCVSPLKIARDRSGYAGQGAVEEGVGRIEGAIALIRRGVEGRADFHEGSATNRLSCDADNGCK